MDTDSRATRSYAEADINDKMMTDDNELLSRTFIRFDHLF